MKQGLLFKDSPEARFELYCNLTIPNTKRERCELLFDNIADFRYHRLHVHEFDWSIKELPVRPLRRFHTNQNELDNMKKKLCWCGKKRGKDNKRIKYTGKFCSDKHYSDWWSRADNVSFHRNKFMNTKNDNCELCNHDPSNDSWFRSLEMDHIIAIVLGGHPWHYDNLQMICHTCHAKKTKIDVQILAAWRQMCRYDLGPIIPDNQVYLDAFMELDSLVNT